MDSSRVEDVFAGEDLPPVLDWFKGIADEWADKLYRARKVFETFKDAVVQPRLASKVSKCPWEASTRSDSDTKAGTGEEFTSIKYVPIRVRGDEGRFRGR